MILVCGSINMDITGYSERLPHPGETIHGLRYLTGLGGKGANQAAAAARLGGVTRFLGRVGKDSFGADALSLLGGFGVDTSNILTDALNSTGIALINVAGTGENSITVIAGANMAVSAGDIERKSDTFRQAKVLLLQLEIPLTASLSAAALARSAGRTVILDPAPATADLPGEFFSHADIFTPNEIETETLTGVRPENEQSAREAAAILHGLGVTTVLIKLGPKGVYVSAPALSGHFAAFPVKAVDTVAAGDCFNGGLAYALAEGQDLAEAVRFASACGALSTTRYGAAASAPTLPEVRRLLAQS